MNTRIRSFLRLASVPILTLMLLSFACFGPAGRLRAVAAQSPSPTGSYGFMIYPAFNPAAVNPTGLTILGVMNFDGAGNVTGTYTY